VAYKEAGMGGRIILKVGAQVRVKKLWKILWFELKNVKSQSLKMTSACLSNVL